MTETRHKSDHDVHASPPSTTALNLLTRILSQRGLDPSSVVEHDPKYLQPMGHFAALDRAVEKISEFLGRSILVFGDYDADGICSTTITVLGLRALGAKQVDYLLPNRMVDGYGLSAEILKQITEAKPDLLVMVDQGTSSGEQIKLLNEQGIVVVVLDHHLIHQDLESWDSQRAFLVNPQLPECPWEDKDLCATAVAYYTLIHLRHRLMSHGGLSESADHDPSQWLDLVALATLADQMPMSCKTNRVLTEEGLRRIRAGQCRLAIKHLATSLNRKLSDFNSRTLSFSLIPLINASGRMGSPEVAVDALLAQELTQSHSLAQALVSLNHERRGIEKRMTPQIDEMLASLPDQDERLVCLAHEDWSVGLISVASSRVAGRLKRPVVIFARHPKTKQWVGSARAGGDYALLVQFQTIFQNQPDLFVNYGGHDRAIGLTIRHDGLQRFQELADQLSWCTLGSAQAEEDNDGALSAQEMTYEVAHWLLEATVWGRQMPLPVFAGEFQVIRSWMIKGNHVCFELAVPGSDLRIEAIRFNWQKELPTLGQRLHIHYELNCRNFRERSSLQLLIRHWHYV